MTSFSNHFFTIQTDPEHGTFSVLPSGAGFPRVETARMLVHYRVFDRKAQAAVRTWSETEPQPDEIAGIGSIRTLAAQTEPDTNGLSCRIEFALSDDCPLFFWRLSLTHTGELPVTVDRLELLRTGGQAQEGRLVFSGGPSANAGFYANGWQSWSLSGAFGSHQALPHTRLGMLQSPMVDLPGTPSLQQPGYFGSDLYGILVDRSRRTALLAGFLAQREQFGSLEAILFDLPSLRMWANGDGALLEGGQTMQTDWAVLFPFEIDQPDAIAPYLDAVARHHGIRPARPVPTGWCSWYYYYTKVTAQEIDANLKQVVALSPRLPLDLVQIDDGFETRPGDWFSFRPTFPAGVAPLAAEIKASGKTPGLWLAPFIVHPKSALARQHPDWLLRTKSGRRARAGFVWNTLPYVLDLTHPEALHYTREVIRTAVHEWGFPYLKLDFLYAAALEGRYRDPTRTRAQVLHTGMAAIRAEAGEAAFLLGCGLPLGSALGWVDAMRISADVGEAWRPRFANLDFPFKDEWRMPSARNAIQNTLTRAHLHRRWWINDPDCLLVRPDSNLTLAEVQTLAAAIGLTGGSLLLSDDLSRLPEERLRIAESLLPVIDAPAWVIDWLDETTPRKIRVNLTGPSGEWQVLAWFNPTEAAQPFAFRPADYHLPPGSYWVRSFWDGETVLTTSGEGASLGIVPPHGTVVLAVRPVLEGQPQYLGSDLHISQGIELAEWSPQADGLALTLRLPRGASGTIDLALPSEPQTIESAGYQMVWQALGDHRYRISVKFDGNTQIEIHYT